MSGVNAAIQVRRRRVREASGGVDCVKFSPIRLTAALGLVLAIMLGVLVSQSSASAGVQGSVSAVEVATVQVEAGDTLWVIAKRHGRTGDVYRDMRDIRRVNGMSSSLIHPGQQLRLP